MHAQSVFAVVAGILLLAAPRASSAHEKGGGDVTPGPTTPLSDVSCTEGQADVFPCVNVDLRAFVPLGSIGGGEGNDVWGWTDPTNGREYALMGLSTGTAFIDVTVPENPVHLGNLPSRSGASSWRDIKVYLDHAFIVSEALAHGMQVFDLTRLRSVASPPVTFSSDAVYDGFATAHNLAVNGDTGFVYAVGTNTCDGGLHIVDARSPLSPTFAGCFANDGYTHDAHCVTYSGPDTQYSGQEVCFNANEDTLTVVDVSDKDAPVQISRTGYVGFGYTHQGWLTPDHRYLLADDELDETNAGHNTRTYVWDVSDLDAPVVVGQHTGDSGAIDHNQYVHDGHVYQANYTSGLHVLRIEDLSAPLLTEVASFDLDPASDNPTFNGAWSVYPFFDSGIVLLSGIEQGLFVLQPQLGTEPMPTPTPTPVPPESFRISGDVLHYASGLPVGSVEVQLQGPSSSSASTDSAGSYLLEGLPSAAWTVEPRKVEAGTHLEIGALDAVYVLQAGIGERQLDPWQQLACDVTGNGSLSSLDASQILRYSVGLITQFPVAELCDSDWVFAPQATVQANQQLRQPQVAALLCQRGAIGFSPLSADATGQSFAAALLGDCTASWEPATGSQAALVPRTAASPHVRLGRPRRGRSRAANRRSVRVPLYAAASSPFNALDINVRYNRAMLRAVGVRQAALAGSAALAYNTETPGQLRIALASATAFQQSSRPLLHLVFETRSRRALRSLRRSVYLLEARIDGRSL
jgi:choice-of-anchor B domain-containing protein